MRFLIALTLAALSLSAAHAAPKAVVLPLCEDVGVEMPDAVFAFVDGCGSDSDCEEAEDLGRSFYCAKNPTDAYCLCRSW